MSDPENDLVRVVVDPDTCIGAGQCEMLEEDTFVIDDDTMISSVVGSGLLPRPRAELVVDRCPGRAISIVEPTQAEPDQAGETQEEAGS